MDKRLKLKRNMFSEKQRIALFCLTMLVLIINIRHLSSLEIFSVFNDEFGYWSNAAYLVGLDWSGIVSKVPYYSYGYSLMLVPLFFIFDNPIHMYKAAIVLNGLMLSASFLLCYDIAQQLAKGVDKKILMGIAFLISMYPAYVAYSSVAWGECLLILNIWLLIWCFTDLNEKSSGYKFVLIGFLSMFLYMIHQRALGVLIASIIVVGLMKMLGKINLKQVFLVVLPMIILMFIHVYLKEDLQTHLWLNSCGNMTNDYLAQASKVRQIFSIDGLLGLIKISLGHIFYIGTASYLLGYFGIYQLLRKTGRALITTVMNRKLDILNKDQIFLLYAFLLIALLSSLAINIIFMINPARVDHIVYGRYIDMLMGPLILLGFTTVLDKKTNLNRIFMITSVGFIILTISVKLIIDASGLIDFASISSVGLFFTNTTSAVFLPALTAILVCRLIIISLRQNSNKMTIISLILVSICFFATGDSVARKAVASQTAVEIMGIVEYIENSDDNIPVYFLWDDQGNPPYGKRENCNAGQLRIAECYQFLLKDIPVNLVNNTELEVIKDKKFVLASHNYKNLFDLKRDYNFCMNNGLSYLYIVSQTSDHASS